MRGKRPDEGDIRLLRVYARLFFKDECFKNGESGRSSSHLSFLMRTKGAWRGTLAESARRYRARMGITGRNVTKGSLPEGRRAQAHISRS